ncbi:HNH endonuclease signature motif containing protein [Mycobacterium sp. 852013-51886_SCH5428379]|uniref:HNH endonuclease signature motif containing protein n=1 Tax=Mycobacterium sp. 852013-51886_SCH5428379 TaxID=1834111 RepID=UPI0009ED5D90|nr:HNH endonuclease signature motif containing protein [Mycobacterium sp. 852013-51886_SCH5428379]
MFDPAQASFDQLLAPTRPEPAQAGELIAAITAAARRENQDAAARLTAIGDLYALRIAQRDEISDQWAVDTQCAVTAEVAAALSIGYGSASTQVSIARGLRERLPAVAAVFRAGDLNAATVDTLLHRTELITDPDVLACVDAKLAAAAARLMGLSLGQVGSHVDRIIARQDQDAVRRRKKAADRREIWFSYGLDGMSDFGGTMPAAEAAIVEGNLNAMADTVCKDDPRTKKQRRIDAMMAMSNGDVRMQCRCGRSDCAQRDATAVPAVIHVITGPAPTEPAASLVRNDGALPAEQVSRLEQTATTRPLVHPGDAAPEPRYTPSRALADFVRCRDMSCRFPGCDVPAWNTDIDHTIPYGQGGPTQASNLKCLCRLHHLLKTFWGWTDHQRRDGTVVWTSPAGETYVTTPGSAALFPSLCVPTAPVRTRPVVDDQPGDRAAMMPRRRRTRAQNRSARFAAERAANRERRRARLRATHPYFQPAPPPAPGDDPPPF